MAAEKVSAGEASPGRHGWGLAFCLLVLLLAFLLEVSPNGERVSLRNSPNTVLPPLCFTRAFLGIPCPGCGLTRSFVHLARGNWAASVKAHRLGWLVAGLLAFQVPCRLLLLAHPRRFGWLPDVSAGLAVCVVGLLVVNWLLGFLVEGFR